MLNKIHLIGNVGNDPEIKTIGENTVANFSLATSETFKDRSGEKQTKTQWHRITIWGKLATIAESYVKKGSKLYLEGKIEYREYDHEGVKKYATDIICNQMTMLDSKKDSEYTPAAAPKTSNVVENSGTNDNLPF